MALISLNNLERFFNNLKTYISNALNSKANSSHTHSASDITSGLATVATSGSYNDLSNKPSIPVIDSALSSTSTNGLQNKVIKTALDGKANSTHSHNVSDITNLSENWTVTGENLNISFGTSGSTWVYDANTKHLTIS